MWELKNGRVNAYGNNVYDVYREGRFVATIADGFGPASGIKVLLGAMQPAGKAIVRELIDARV